MEITPSTSTESVETITPTQNTHTQSTEKTKLSISEDTQEFVNNFCRIANGIHHVKAEAEKASQIESDKQIPTQQTLINLTPKQLSHPLRQTYLIGKTKIWSTNQTISILIEPSLKK
jgi:uncharacterized protein YaiL (DUF2058 family)